MVRSGASKLVVPPLCASPEWAASAAYSREKKRRRWWARLSAGRNLRAEEENSQ